MLFQVLVIVAVASAQMMLAPSVIRPVRHIRLKQQDARCKVDKCQSRSKPLSYPSPLVKSMLGGIDGFRIRQQKTSATKLYKYLTGDVLSAQHLQTLVKDVVDKNGFTIVNELVDSSPQPTGTRMSLASLSLREIEKCANIAQRFREVNVVNVPGDKICQGADLANFLLLSFKLELMSQKDLSIVIRNVFEANISNLNFMDDLYERLKYYLQEQSSHAEKLTFSRLFFIGLNCALYDILRFSLNNKKQLFIDLQKQVSSWSNNDITYIDNGNMFLPNERMHWMSHLLSIQPDFIPLMCSLGPTGKQSQFYIQDLL